MALVIPLEPKPASNFTTTVEDKVYRLLVRWSENRGRQDSWHIDIMEEDGAAIISGLRLLPYVNLTGRYVDERLPQIGDLYALPTGNPVDQPTFEDLGEHTGYGEGSIQDWTDDQ